MKLLDCILSISKQYLFRCHHIAHSSPVHRETTEGIKRREEQEEEKVRTREEEAKTERKRENGSLF